MAGDRNKVLICSEDTVFARALRRALPGYEVRLSKTPDGDADVVVWRIDGVTSEDTLAAVAAAMPTLILGDDDNLIAAVDAGCRGFLPQDATLNEISTAIDTIASGGAVVPPLLLGSLLRHLVERRRHSTARATEIMSSLTNKEREVFMLAAAGARKEEIGERLFISPGTARTHLQRVYKKLGIHSHAELVALAAGLGADND